MASILVWAGYINDLIRISMSWVSKIYWRGIQARNTYKVLRHDLIRLSDTPYEFWSTCMQILYTISNSLLIFSFRVAASFCKIVPFEKSKTSSDRSFRMFSAFSHLASFSVALLQMSEMKFYHEVLHSRFTIEIRVALSFVRRCYEFYYPLTCSGRLSTRFTTKFRILILFSSSKIYHRIYAKFSKQRKRGNSYIYSIVKDFQSNKPCIEVLALDYDEIHACPSIIMALELVQYLICIFNLHKSG